MVNQRILQEIACIGDDIQPISSDLTKICNKAQISTRRCIADDLCNSLIRLEKNVIKLRSIISRVAPDRSYPQKDALVTLHEISIEEDIHWIKISMPAVVPGKKRRTSPPYLIQPLRDALAEWVRTEGHALFRSCVIVVEHEYDATCGVPRYLDYDNIEVKGIIDVITSRLLTDDSSRLVHIHQAAKDSNRDRTNLYVMSQYSFWHWVDRFYPVKA